MNEPLHFKTRDEFRIWLINHCMSGGGIWLKFEKSKNTAFKAGDALEEALCFGWIDGVMKPISNIFLPAERTANGLKKIKLWQKTWKNAA